MDTPFDNLVPEGYVAQQRVIVYLGSDESLKGDTFGGLVVAGVLVDEKQRDTLRLHGIRDSKTLVPRQIYHLAKHIRSLVRDWEVVSVLPELYNSYDSKGLLNRYHYQVAQHIISRLGKDRSHLRVVHVVDKFPGAQVGDIIETKAESRYPEVAAASILAREAAYGQFDELERRLGWRPPLGSTHVSDALDRLLKEKHPIDRFVKTHFKNVQAAMKKI